MTYRKAIEDELPAGGPAPALRARTSGCPFEHLAHQGRGQQAEPRPSSEGQGGTDGRTGETGREPVSAARAPREPAVPALHPKAAD